MKKVCDNIWEMIRLIDEVAPMITKSLGFRDVYRVYCEEYHTKPPYLLGSKWLSTAKPANIRFLYDLVEDQDYDAFIDKVSKFSSEGSNKIDENEIKTIIEKLMVVKTMCEKTDGFWMNKVIHRLEERAEYNFDFGMLEAEDEMEPADRLLLAMRAPDPIGKIVDLQRRYISIITDYIYTEKKRIDVYKDYIKPYKDDSQDHYDDVYRFFSSESEAHDFLYEISKLGKELDEFTEKMKAQNA